MRIRRLVYTMAPVTVLSKRVDKIKKELREERDSKKRMRLIDEDFDILIALIRKNRNNKEFMTYVRDYIAEFVSNNG